MPYADPWTGKLRDHLSDFLPAPNGNKCEFCHGDCIDRCMMCGAPQCCPSCCFEASEEDAGRQPSTYRRWNIEFVYPPIPFRGWDWQATHPDYDGAPDANDGRHVSAETRELLIAEIDAWFEENPARQAPAQADTGRE